MLSTHHFLNSFFSQVRTWLLLIAVVFGLGVSGCSRKAAPSSIVESTATKSDSSTERTASSTESINVSETVEEKILTGATVGVTLTPAQLDSLLGALRQMPTASTIPGTVQATRTVYYQDPKLKAQLTILMDSIGRVTFKCQAMDQTYYERHVQEIRRSTLLQSEVTRALKENHSLREELKEARKSFLERAKDWTRNITLNLLLVIIAAGVTVWLIRNAGRIVKRFIKPL